MKIFKNYWFLIILGLLSFFLFSFNIKSSASFEGDLGRDLFEIGKISYGNFTLLGPKGSFGGIYTAPYHYYIFLLPFLITGRQLSGILFFNIILFSSSLVFFSYHAGRKFGRFNGFLSCLAMMFLPFIIVSARTPGNGFTPVTFFIFFLTIVYFYDINEFRWKKILFLGMLLGLILSMLFAYIIILVPILFLIYAMLKNKKLFFIFLIGIFLAFTPLILFELKNNFVMLKNTFIDKSYLSFVNNTNLPNGVKLNKNIFINAIDLGNKIFPLININIYLVFIFLLTGLVWINKSKEKIFIYASFLSYIFLIFMLRFQYSTHYLLSFSTLLVFTLFIIILNSKLSKIVFISIIFISLLFFSKKNYSTAVRNYSLVKSRGEYILSKHLVKKGDQFNIILKRDDNLPTPAGNEYRFFFLMNGLEPQSEFLYKNSSKLIIFSEDIEINFKEFNTWEMSEFDYSKVKKVSRFSPDTKMTVYLLEK